MNSLIVAVLALACVLGLSTANYYGYPGVDTGSGGQSGLFMLLFLFLFLFLFNNNNTSSSSGTVTIVNASASG